MKRIFLFTTIFLFAILSFSQTHSVKEKKDGWHLLDQEKVGYMGISLQKAYDLLKGRKSTTVIVAVIDSGIDTAQEDLKNVLWKNQKEINGNGVDDDKNGYVDDIYGWNFCGSKDGQNMLRNSHEIARVYHNWKKEFEGKEEKDMPSGKKFLYSQWIKASGIINKDYDEASKELPQISNILNTLEKTSKDISDYLSVKEFAVDQVKPLLADSARDIAMAATLWSDLFKQIDDTSAKNTFFIEDIKGYKGQLDTKISRKLEEPKDWRSELVKDNYTDINDRSYGNNNLKEGSGDHGTLVAGTIGAIRNNGTGVDGIADNVRIMAIRAVPGGDEHDKDIALAIRYAVDNGAKIINMSFGKPVSPYKQFVDDAVRYAASKGVLLVHGSGNEGKDITTDIFYPNPVFIDGKKATNYITVGASGDESVGGYAAPFSNYSHQNVDIFAPGMNIHSTAPGNVYKNADGTSLACPVAAGVAALLKSYFPELSPEQIISIINTSGKPIDKEVSVPGDEEKKVKFSSLSSSGRIINAYEAVRLALQWKKEKKF
ncbi:MAG TPA: S8 family serine peptidase [Chitinophagaceae bacterium]|nr:S8 family serine peptidase [Chitinophagaceae bacterium]